MVAEYNRIRHRLIAFLDLGSLINIKKLIGFQDLSASLVQNRFNLACENILWYNPT